MESNRIKIIWAGGTSLKYFKKLRSYHGSFNLLAVKKMYDGLEKHYTSNFTTMIGIDSLTRYDDNR